MTRNIWPDGDVIEAVSRAKCMADVLRYMGVKPSGFSYITAKRHINRLGLSTEHFAPRTFKGVRRKPRPIQEFLVRGIYVSTSSLRVRLIKEGFLVNQCYFEDCPTRPDNLWRGKVVGLQLDHINGDRSDNTLANLRLLCPNCHTQTPNYAGRNISRKAIKAKCIDCKQLVTGKSLRCVACYAKFQQHIEWPSLDVLLDMISKSNYSAVGRELGVTDNAVRKAIKRMQQS